MSHKLIDAIIRHAEYLSKLHGLDIFTALCISEQYFKRVFGLKG